MIPGAMMYTFTEELLVQSTMQQTGFAFLERHFKVKAPTFIGDTIHAESQVSENRRPHSRPNRGLVRTQNDVFKQGGTLVPTYTPLRMVEVFSGG